MSGARIARGWSDAAPAAPAAAGAAPERPAAVAGARVLVVDDTEGNRYAVSRLLRGAGMRVTETENAAGAYRELESWVPDLVVLDINLPDASGHDVCAYIKSAGRTAAVPVLHVSASFVTNADRAYGLEHGADAYLTHPLDPAVFVATARALLRAETERVRLYQEEHEARRAAEGAAARATLLQDLTAALARTMSAAEVSQVVLTRAFVALGAAAGMLTVATPDGQQLELLGTANLPDEVARRSRRAPVTASVPTAEAVRTADAISLPTHATIVARYAAWDREVLSLLPSPPGSAYVAPMVVDRGPNARVHGAILFLWTAEQAVDAAAAALITAAADQCALALERARLYEAERVARAAAESARVEAEQANAVKAQFLAVMSHELRTPLNAIGGHAELLEMGIHGPVTDAQLDALARIRRSQEHLLGLINSVLNFAKLEAGRVEYRVEPTPIADAVRAVEALIGPLAHARGLTLGTSACDATLVARADGEKLRQVLLNLLSNAVKFTARGGSVRVTCGRTHADDGTPRVQICVADTGRGIAAAELQRVFDPFVQVGGRLASTDAGTGLGLAISRDLARGMGGELSAVSEVGVGSTFTLSLPAA